MQRNLHPPPIPDQLGWTRMLWLVRADEYAAQRRVAPLQPEHWQHLKPAADLAELIEVLPPRV
ncbi:hypothetical protein ACIOTI_31975 [Streptomyces sp. NPDC087843]|uniref:hypothetical protein n=1 Tax=Streptomyces sp. NPDC087843 TaxID=3365804 RepID=UPI0038184FFF